MTAVFQNLAACAVAGTVCSGVFWLLRHVTRRILGAEKQYLFWILILLLWVLPLRFALPVYVGESYTEKGTEDIYTAPSAAEIHLPSPSPGNSVPMGEEILPAKGKMPPPILPVLQCIWGLGIPVAAALQCIPYLRFRRLLKRTALPVGDLPSGKGRIPVYSCSAVDSPMVAGFFRPVLYLPDKMYTAEAFSCILRHELTHVARQDIPLKWFAAAVRCLHWWNPLAHLAVRQFSQECEISCDFRAAVGMDEEQRKTYMRLLLNLAEEKCRKRAFLTTGFSDSKQFMKRRLFMIQNGKKQKTITAILSSILLAGLSAGLIYGSGVLRDTVLPEKTDMSDEIPVVDTAQNEETYTEYEEDLESLKQELESHREDYEAMKEEADDAVWVYDDTVSVNVPYIIRSDREINLGYGFYSLKWKNENVFHNGVDFKGEAGEEVLSASAGEITYMGYDYSYGNMIIVKSGDYEICYAHLSEFAPELAVGDTVEIDTVIGEIGQTGAVTGPHLHFEIRLDGQPIAPASIWVE